MAPRVSIVAPGMMGASLAKVLVDNGVEVRSDLSGRSPQSQDRARQSGMAHASDDQIVDVDFFLSIVPPQEAVAVARRFAGPLRNGHRKPIYVDCNAINPATAAEISKIIEATGTSFVDGSIIGMPARAGYAGPTIFVSGRDAKRLSALQQHGLFVRTLDGPVGAASALKMSYGGITKGLIALGSAMILGAEQSGVSRALHEEMSRTQSQLLQGFSKSIPDMFPKAARWVPEMEEIATFVGNDTPQGQLFLQIGAFYSMLAAKNGEAAIAALTRFFEEAGDKK